MNHIVLIFTIPMDELISKLRSQVTQTQKDDSEDDITIVNNEISLVNNEITIIKNDTVQELTTSQSDVITKNRFKLDFDLLRRYRPAESMKVSDLKECDLFKVNESLWAIVKSIESFKGLNGNVYRWEIIDETGVIFGSSNVNDQNISVGCIVCLEGFSIWKHGGNHLNIVSRNIKKVIN